MESQEITVPVINEPGFIAEAAELGRQISTGWQKAAHEVLLTAGLCETAFRRYGSEMLPVLLAAHMSKPTFRKLVSIGRDQRLKRIEGLLPPSFSTIYEITQFGDETLEEAVRAGVIHPHVRRSDIQSVRKLRYGKDKVAKQDCKDVEAPTTAEAAEIPPGNHFELIFPKNAAPEHCAQIRQILDGLRAKFGVEVLPVKALEAAKTVANPVLPSGSRSSPVNQKTIVRTVAKPDPRFEKTVAGSEK